MTIYCATTNVGKLREFRQALGPFFDLQVLPGLQRAVGMHRAGRRDDHALRGQQAAAGISIEASNAEVHIRQSVDQALVVQRLGRDRQVAARLPLAAVVDLPTVHGGAAVDDHGAGIGQRLGARQLRVGGHAERAGDQQAEAA